MCCNQLLAIRSAYLTTLCLKKVSHLFVNNIGKCRPIFKILLPIDS